MPPVRVLQASVRHTGTYTRPAYDLMAAWPSLFGAIHQAFSPLGAQLEDIRFEGQSSQPHESVVICAMLRLNAAIRFRLTNVEVWTGNHELIRTDGEADYPGVTDLVERAAGVVSAVVSSLSFVSHAAEVYAHVRLPVPVADVLSRLVNAPKSMRSEGARLSMGTEDGVRATVSIDPSAIFPGPENAWVFANIYLPATLAPRDVCVRATKLVVDVLGDLGVELDWTKP